MHSKFRKYLNLNLSEKLLLLLATLLSLYYSLIVIVLPFSLIIKLLGQKGKVLSNEVSEVEYQKIRKVEKTITRLSKHLPIKVKCLAKSMATKFILKKFNINSTIYLGVSFEKTKKIDAHAWLICGGIVVSGKEEVSRFKPLVFFS